MSAKTNKVPAELYSLNSKLKQLSIEPGFQSAQSAINELVSLLGIDVSADGWSLINDSRGKIKANASWFEVAEGFGDRRATYKLAENNENNLDFKAFWVQKTTKSIISWAVALTPNFEDEPYNVNKNVGIDFFIPKKADRIIITLSKDYIIRTLELSGQLSPTQQNILVKWTQPFDFSNKAQVHEILWESFDLEPVNKEFYKEISSYFVELKQHLSGLDLFDEQHASYFTSRLIGRLIFCWFIDKKGFINPEMEYFETDTTDSTKYYHSKLEKLFFATLNTPKEDRGVKWESVQKGLFASDASTDLFNFNVDNVTPFLNGGLFEERQSDHVGNKNLTFPADYFNRLITTLNHYNFTTDESTSSFQQVAIDPEMLGRIFENLLAEQSEETGEQARKAKGAFYTPREIVDYMSRESLREYLKTKVPEDEMRDYRLALLLDKKPHEFKDQQSNYRRDLKPYKTSIIQALDELKVLDPACGSGAFPMGMLQLLVQVYERLEPRFDPYETKVSIVKNNIFGVDIEPMAVEISRLRTWLSIIVDEEVESDKVKPLPNLDFKFVCANTLIPLDRKGSTQLMDNPNLEDDLLEIRDKYFNARTHKSKQNLRDKFDKLIGHTGNGKQNTLLMKSHKQKQLETYKPFNPESSATFFDSEFMFGINKFNIVIGNPPYIKEYTNKRAFDGLRDSKYYMGKMDLWYFFSCSGIDLLEDGGIETFIAPNNWVSNYGAKIMRKKILKESTIVKFIDFGDYKVFDTAGIQTMVYLLKKAVEKEPYQLEYKKLNVSNLKNTQLLSFLSSPVDEESDRHTNFRMVFDQHLFENDYIDFIKPEILLLINKILNSDTLNLQSHEVAQGIVFPQDYLNKKNNIKLGKKYSVGDGIFVLNNDEKKQLSLSPDELSLIKPYYDSSNFYKYGAIKNNNLWVIYTDSKFKNENSLDNYPNIKKHLDKFRSIITSDNKPYGLHRSRDEHFFKGEKIVAIRKCARPSFSYTDFDCYVSATFNVIKPESLELKFLTGLLNSKLIAFWLKFKGKMQGSNYQIDKEPILSIPIIKSDKETQKKLALLVDEIISLLYPLDYDPNRMPDEQKVIQEKINSLVYSLYGLNKEDIELVEKSINET